MYLVRFYGLLLIGLCLGSSPSFAAELISLEVRLHCSDFYPETQVRIDRRFETVVSAELGKYHVLAGSLHRASFSEAATLPSLKGEADSFSLAILPTRLEGGRLHLDFNYTITINGQVQSNRAQVMIEPDKLVTLETKTENEQLLLSLRAADISL